MHLSFGWTCTDHVADHTLITWLIMHWSHNWSCTDHMAHQPPDQCVMSHVILHWSHGSSRTDPVADHTRITWLIMYRSRGWSYADHDSNRLSPYKAIKTILTALLTLYVTSPRSCFITGVLCLLIPFTCFIAPPLLSSLSITSLFCCI